MELRHSGMGVAAFVLSLVAGMLLLGTIGIAAMLQVITPGGIDPRGPSTVLVGLVMMLGVLIALIAGGLGAASLFQAARRRLFGVLGLVFSVASVLLLAVLWVIGRLAG